MQIRRTRDGCVARCQEFRAFIQKKRDTVTVAGTREDGKHSTGRPKPIRDDQTDTRRERANVKVATVETDRVLEAFWGCE